MYQDCWFRFGAILVALAVILVTWMKWAHSYWKRKGLLTPKPTFFFGNAKPFFLQTSTVAIFMDDIYKYIKRHKAPHGGIYFLAMPVYVPIDLSIIKSIMQTDFQHFMDRGVYVNEENDPLSAHLFSLSGTKWKNMRAKMTPTFTSGKMKMMFETLLACSDQLTIEMDKNVGKECIEIKDILARFTIDIIGTCAFGIDCNSLKDPNNEFRAYGRRFFEKTILENIKAVLTFIAPEFMRLFGTLAVEKELSDFFIKVVKQTVEYREKNNIHRKDFMQLLLQLKNKGTVNQFDDSVKINEELKFSFNDLAAQAFIFFLAGFETSSTTMTFCLFELASNPEVQEKLREEINHILKKHKSITYEAIMEMTYMEQVINETLRKYPPLPALNRVCTKDYKVPGTDIVLEKGTKIFIPVYPIQRDEDIYPNPEKFDPERFSEENKELRHPYTFLPFGEGPRVCIGLRFGYMQTKVGLTVLLKNYKFRINAKTTLPLELDTRSFIMSTKDGIWLDYVKV